MQSMRPVTVHLPRDLKRWLEKEAQEVDQTLAAYVRRILKLHRIKEEETHHEPKPEEAAAPEAGPESERPGP